MEELMEIKAYDSTLDCAYERTIGTLNDEVKNLSTCTEWIVTEKLHGSNIAIIVDNSGKHTLASRAREISIGQFGELCTLFNFFRSDILYTDIVKDKIPLIHSYIVENGIENIHIFGEWFGHWMTKDGKECHIQTGVEYGGLHYRVFDMAYKVNGEWSYIPYWKMRELVDYFGFEYVPILGVYDSVYTAIEKYREDMNIVSDILPKEGNFIEGIVIRPMTELKVRDNRYRVQFKMKHPTYTERRDYRKRMTDDERFKDLEITENVERMLNVFYEQLTVARWQSVLSKVGEGCYFFDYIQIFQNDVVQAFEDALYELNDPNLSAGTADYHFVRKLGGEEIGPFLVQNTDIVEKSSMWRTHPLTTRVRFNKNFVSGRRDGINGINLRYPEDSQLIGGD